MTLVTVISCSHKYRAVGLYIQNMAKDSNFKVASDNFNMQGIYIEHVHKPWS
jgi:hypothetical protein